MKRIKNVSKKMLALLISALILVSMIPMSMFMVFAADDYDVTITVVDKTNNPLPELNVKFKLTDPATESFCTAKKVSEGVYLLEQASQALAAAQSGSGSITVIYNVEATGREMVYGEVVITRDNRNIEVNVAELEEPFIEFTNPEYNLLSIAEVWYGKNAKNTFDVSAVTNEDNASAIKYEIVDSTVADAVVDENGVATVNGIGNVKVRAWVETNDVYDFNERFITIITKNDNIAPTDLDIEYSVDYKDEKVVSNKEIIVTLTGTDNETGVYKYYYKLDSASDYIEVTGNSFTMNPMYRGTLSVIVEDCAENTSTFDNGGRLIVLDNENPKINAVYTMEDGANIFTKADGVKYTNGNITVDFEIKDANLDISGQPEVKVNGVVVPVTWDQATGKGTFVLTESGVYNYSVKYEDIATNTTVVDSETTLAIDREPPVINAIHGNPTEWTNQSITLTVEATDAGCEGILYSMNDGATWQESPDFTIDVNGKYYFITKDALDNTSDPTEVIVTKIDKVAPTVSDVISDQLDENGNVIWVNPDLTPDLNDVTVEGKVTDDLSGVVKLFRKINDGEFEEISFDAAASSFADGSINVECKDIYTYYCVDAATNKSEEVSIEVKIDKTAPQLVEKISEQTNVDITINGSVTDEGTVIKDGSGTAKVYYRLKDIETEWTAATLNGTSFTFDTNLAGRKSGFYYYEIYFKDNAGNESAVDGTSIEVEYDGTKPVVTMEPLDPEKWTNKERVIRGKFTDDWSGVKSAKYVRYDGDTVVEDIALTFDADGNFEFTIPNDKNNIDTYKITCVDNFTNVSDVVEFIPYIDVVAPAKPTITYKTTAIQKFLQFVSFGVYQAEPTVVIESSDDLSGVKEIEYTLGDKTETIKAVDGKIEITVPYGTKAKLTAVAYDNAGNNSEQKDTGKDPVDYEFGTVIVDNEAPVVDKAEADITDWTNGDVVISGTVSDALSGVKEVYIKKETATEFTVFATATTDADVTEFTYTIPAQDYEGNYIIYCKDYAGNESEKVAVAVKMDITKPVVDTIKAQPDVWTNTDVIVSGTVSDNLSGVNTVYYKLSDGVVKTATLNDGAYTIVIKAEDVKNYKGDVIVWCDDNAKNVSDEKAVAIAIDTEKPVVDDGIATPNYWTNKNVVVSGKVHDVDVDGIYSDVANVQIKKDVEGAEWSDVDFFDETTKDYSHTVTTISGAGTYLIRTIDYAGNVSESVEVEVYIDVIPPVVESGKAVSADWTNENVEISGLVSDEASGVANVYIKKNVEGAEWEKVDSFDAATGAYTHIVEAQNYEGEYLIYCEDVAGNKSTDNAEAFSISVKMDVDAPTDVKVEYDADTKWEQIKEDWFGFKKETITATLTANDNLSGIAGFAYSIDGGETFIPVDANGEFAIDPQYRGKLIFKAFDLADNEVTVDNDGRILVIDSIAPTVKVEYIFDEDKKVVYSEEDNIYYTNDEAVDIEFVITEANFDLADAPVVTINGTAQENVEWTQDSENKDNWVGKITLEGDGDYNINIKFADRSGNAEIDYTVDAQFRIDNTAPEISVKYDPAEGTYFTDGRKAEITVVEHNFVPEKVKAIIEATDIEGNTVSVKDYNTYFADINNWTVDGDVYTTTITFDTDANYKFALTCSDIIDNTTRYPSQEDAYDEFILDKTGPQNLSIKYTEPTIWQEVLEGITFGFYQANVEVTLIAEDVTSGVDSFEWNYTREEGASTSNVESKGGVIEAKDITYSNEGKTATATFLLKEDELEQYRGSISFTATDKAGNESDSLNDKNRINIVDTIAPTLDISYSDAVAEKDGVYYYNTDNVATLTITEANFYGSEVVVKVVKDGVESVVTVADWKQDGDKYTGTFTLSEDGKYTVKVDYTDRSSNKMNSYTSNLMVVDQTAPTDVKIIERSVKLTEKILEKVTLGFYKAKMDVEISAYDATSGVESFVWAYVKDENSSNINADTYEKTIESKDIQYSADGKTATAKFEVPANAKGHLEINAIDYATNSTKMADKGTINVVDNTNPVFSVDYGKANEVTDNSTVAYYKNNCEVAITIKEANFFSEEVKVVVTKDGVDYPVSINWTDSKDDTHVGKFTLFEDGDYEVKISYTDYSENIMVNGNNEEIVEHKSQRIVIDKTAPTVDVEYSSETNGEETAVVFKDYADIDREYFKNGRVATIIINEHNFRVSEKDIKVTVNANDVFGNELDIRSTLENAYNTHLRDAQNWGYFDAEGKITYDAENAVNKDVHVAQIIFSEQANYTFDIEYADLATNKAADYVKDYFTVDSTVPANLKVEYSTPQLWKKILEDVTFGFYNATMDVTISATDDIAGIYQFMFSYINNDGVSKVNADLKDQIVVPEYNDELKRYESSFTIPLGVALDENNQFNGTIKFAAYDRSGNVSEKTDSNTVVVVDSIAPTSTVTFNAPVKVIEDVSYYNSDIEAKVVITEANFYSEDVEIIVTKNGTPTPITVKWTDNSVDEHVGTFTLSEDGDYIVKVNYTDRSTNQMTPFESKQLTIDKTTPVITVGDVVHGSANNDEVIGLTVTVTDTNIAAENIKPVLNAVVQKDAGNNVYTYETVAISLGEPVASTNDKGETVYTYTVKNFKLDGYYTLVCNAVDNAGHSVSAINAPSGNGGTTSVKAMNYSVNRNGSVFWLKTEHNDKYTGETFTDKLNGAYANDKVVVKLYERNVDMVDVNEEKKTVFTLNDGSDTTDVLLVENDNYTKNVIVGTGAWYETVYTLDDDNFDNDGVYSLNIITYDRAENSNLNTKTESGTINFTLDRTNPVISANVKTGQTINAANFDVQFEIADANLDADTIEVVLIDRKGNEKVIDKAKIEALGKNEFKFNVGSGLNYSIKVKAKDLAGNTSEIYSVEELTISTNIFVRWYANTPLFWGSIAAVVLLTAVIVIIIILKKKNDKDK